MLNKRKFRFVLLLLSMLLFFAFSTSVLADGDEDEYPPAGDESGTFISVAPDALIVVDLSGSMNFNPLGTEGYPFGSTFSCAPDTAKCKRPLFSLANCSGGYCDRSITGCNVNCSRLAIAKRALFSVLDSDGNNVINNADSSSLGIRIGYMRFYNCSSEDSSVNYSTGCNKLVTTISTLGSETGTSYQRTYCGHATVCNASATSCSSGECIVGASASGGTPIAQSLREAKQYLDLHKNSDPAKACRQKFVILVTDGADTFACGGSGAECQTHMYKRRREVVAATRELANAGYKVFVIGFGAGMPSYLTNTLHWAAYYGGTDNPSLINTGNPSDYNIPSTSLYPETVSACSNASSMETATCYTTGGSSNTSNFKASANDPGYLNLSGYAFIAEDADQLNDALKVAIDTIRSSTYSFTQASIQAVRTVDENYVYEASFEPVNNDPFWIGHLRRYRIDESGFITAQADWDAGLVLKNTSAAARKTRIYTLVDSSGLTLFDSSGVTDAILGVAPGQGAAIKNFIFGGDTAYVSTDPNYGWKLGDIFHSSPLSIATPNKNFVDPYDTSGTAWKTFRENNSRNVQGGGRIVLTGSNDGQLRAFRALDGGEIWSFIPPNLLSRLQRISHSSHPTLKEHTYFVDGPLSAADIWTGSGTIGETSKSASDWKTYLAVGLGRGGISTLWSKSPNCVSDFGSYYITTTIDPDTELPVTGTYPYYCGFYAFDITATTSAPVFKWLINDGTGGVSSTNGPYLGQAWSKMYMGRVRINNEERWVGFLGGGYSGTNCASSTTCDTRGKGFFVVDLKNGTIIQSFVRGGANVTGTMNYDFAAPPIVIDYDTDGFLDTAYIGDLGGNIWRFKLCLSSDDQDENYCDASDWTADMLFQNAGSPTSNQAIYTVQSVTLDRNYDIWVYAGTGDKTDPTGKASKGRVLGMKDTTRRSETSSPYTLSDLSGDNGWYINLDGNGEKVLAEPVVFGEWLFVTSYIPDTGTEACNKAGTAKYYQIRYLTGGIEKSVIIGAGIPSAPVVSVNPHKKNSIDIYVSMSEEAEDDTRVHTVKINPEDDTLGLGDGTKPMRYWYDMRLQ